RLSVLLGSGGIATEARRKLYRKLVSEHFSGCSEVLFIPYASNDHSAYTERMGQFLGESNPKLVGIEAKGTKRTCSQAEKWDPTSDVYVSLLTSVEIPPLPRRTRVGVWLSMI
ncbi:MAG: hypothetical protein CXT66_07005, partial [Methanobacteriota archaeon]